MFRAARFVAIALSAIEVPAQRRVLRVHFGGNRATDTINQPMAGIKA